METLPESRLRVKKKIRNRSSSLLPEANVRRKVEWISLEKEQTHEQAD